MNHQSAITSIVGPFAEETALGGEVAVGQVIAGRYEVRDRLGIGASAVVYRAQDRLLGHEVALKLLHQERVGPAALARLRREAAIARQLNSPHLVRVFDIGVAEPMSFLTMELVTGGTLKERIAAGPLTLAEVLRWAGQLLAGLAALHRQGVAHRDVKPGNVLLSADGDLKLADLGLARRLGGDETRATMHAGALGTWDYLAPEQVAGQDGDARSDLYAAGLVLFEMLTGSLPYSRERSLAALLHRLRGRGPGLKRLRRVAPRWLRRFVSRLLAPDPEQRYADASAALVDYERQSVTLTRRAWRPILVVGTVAAILVVGLGFVGRARPAQFLRLEADGETAIIAVGRGGEALWRRDHVDAGCATRIVPLRRAPGAHPVLAGVLREPGDNAPERMRVLSFLDPDSGAVAGSERLVSGVGWFPGYPDRYHPEHLLARDLDGDGVDELLVTYYLEAQAPSYTVLYEPALHRSRVLFAASGYHRIEDLADVDGDGRPEAIFVGTNNRMGWVNAVAAVAIDPWIGAASSDPDLGGPALSPDRVTANRTVVWYTLLPRGYTTGADHTLSVSSTERQVTVHLRTAAVTVGFDGFLVGRHAAPLEERRRDRAEAYRHLQEVYRHLASRDGDAALAEAREGRAAAVRAEDQQLAGLLARFVGKALVAAAQPAAAARWFDDLVEGSPDASEISFDAAVAFHTAGDLELALRWYRRGLGRGATDGAGKSKIAFLEGIVFGLLEQGDAAGAGREIEGFVTAYPDWANTCALFRQVARWQAGALPDTAGLAVTFNMADDLRYLELELRNARGEGAEELLSAVRGLEAEAYDAMGGLYSLEGELLRRLGRRAEAVAAGEKAVAWLAAHRLANPQDRFLLLLAGRRRAALTGHNLAKDI